MENGFIFTSKPSVGSSNLSWDTIENWLSGEPNEITRVSDVYKLVCIHRNVEYRPFFYAEHRKCGRCIV